jgi:hypothetical protein
MIQTKYVIKQNSKLLRFCCKTVWSFGRDPCWLVSGPRPPKNCSPPVRKRLKELLGVFCIFNSNKSEVTDKQSSFSSYVTLMKLKFTGAHLIPLLNSNAPACTKHMPASTRLLLGEGARPLPCLCVFEKRGGPHSFTKVQDHSRNTSYTKRHLQASKETTTNRHGTAHAFNQKFSSVLEETRYKEPVDVSNNDKRYNIFLPFRRPY